ncbi:hypothetical protein P4475_15860, partial [Halalkalibacterium halodurans]|uniref:hypothetical protein n=1 Tax=Halalkalibacterium halodurans TaxID=86665 RepID=UPI002E2090DB|nr:hypothetical protein [Halalkalibacterium halodurans]
FDTAPFCTEQASLLLENIVMCICQLVRDVIKTGVSLSVARVLTFLLQNIHPSFISVLQKQRKVEIKEIH